MNHKVLRLLYHHQQSVKNFPDDISMMKMSQCRVDDGDDTNIRAVTDIVVDDELEVGDVDQGQTPRMLLKSLFIKRKINQVIRTSLPSSLLNNCV